MLIGFSHLLFFISFHAIPYTLVQPLVTYQTSWLESTGLGCGANCDSASGHRDDCSECFSAQAVKLSMHG